MGSRLARVRTARVTTAAIAVAALAFAASGASLAPVSAQAQIARMVVGMYAVKNYTVDGKPRPGIVKKMKPLYLKPDERYVWGGYHAPFRSRGLTIDLDCQPVSGLVSLQVRPFTIVTTEYVAGLEGFKEEHKTYLEYQGPVEAFPTREPTPDDCRYRHHQATPGRPTTGPVADLHPRRGALEASLQAQAGPLRGVNGQVLLAIGARADVDLWACIVEGGYPDVVMGERGATPQEVSVFPGGRFRTDVRGGVEYSWAFTISGCETPARQPDPAASVGPGPAQRPATEEKIVLGCYVSGGMLTRCNGWWLVRPE